MTARIESPYWFEFDRDILEYKQRPDKTYAHEKVGTQRLIAQVLTISIETQNVRVRAFDPVTAKYFGTFDTSIDKFFENFEIFKKSPR